MASIVARALKAPIARPTATTAIRSLSTTASRAGNDKASPFNRGPAPPRLPQEEQEIFEELQRKSTGAFSTPQVNQAAGSEEASQMMHPDAVAGVRPEFDGDKNPKTGEVGGPKNEPLRWGAEGDWSYGGRVTDF